jgi:copper oxidase (laccase) domain-containing protein
MVGAVGPAIGGCCYTVGEEVREQFTARFGYASDLFREASDRLHLDLAEANRRQLAGTGIGDVTVLAECTACARVHGRRKYFSHRAERGFTGRAMGMIGIAAHSK